MDMDLFWEGKGLTCTQPSPTIPQSELVRETRRPVKQFHQIKTKMFRTSDKMLIQISYLQTPYGLLT